MGKDYYKILGVDKGASENELKKGKLFPILKTVKTVKSDVPEVLKF